MICLIFLSALYSFYTYVDYGNTIYCTSDVLNLIRLDQKKTQLIYWILKYEGMRTEQCSCNKFVLYLCSADNKDFWANKNFLKVVPTLTGEKSDLVAFVLYIGIFTMILTPTIRIIWDLANLYLTFHITRHCRNLFLSELT